MHASTRTDMCMRERTRVRMRMPAPSMAHHHYYLRHGLGKRPVGQPSPTVYFSPVARVYFRPTPQADLMSITLCACVCLSPTPMCAGLCRSST